MTPFPFAPRTRDRAALDPVESATVDEAISALLDDEFDTLALEYGANPLDARRRLSTWPGFAARRRALETARAAVAQPVAALAALDVERLLAATHAAATPSVPSLAVRRDHRRRVRVTAMLGVAAATVVVLAFGFSIMSGNSGDSLHTVGATISDSSGDSAGTAAVTTAGPIPGADVGSLDDESYRRALLGEQRGAGTSASEESVSKSGDAPSAPRDGCVRSIPSDETVVAIVTGSYQGRAVWWITTDGPGGPTGRIIDPNTCAVYSVTTL